MELLSLDGPRGNHLPAGYLEIHYPGLRDDPAGQTILRWCRRNGCDLLALADFLIDEPGEDQSAVWTLPLDRVAELLKAPPAPMPPPADPPLDKTAYIPGKDCRNDRITTPKQLKALLSEVPNSEQGIRHFHKGQRLYVHAGDWHRHFERMDKDADAAMDRVSEAAERELRRKKSRGPARQSSQGMERLAERISDRKGE